jgi:GT2 family glycosyltransferase
VAIGRNEGPRLQASLFSALQESNRVVYVDSGSTDGSAALARRLGAAVVELDSSRPYTAARARNAGFAFVTLQYPDAELVQFLDGDCELTKGWLERASRELESRPEVAAVFGRRREIDAGRSIFSRLFDLEWDGPKGETKAFGGDVLLRASVFRDTGGFDDSLIAGEEPELCVRIRRRGWKILRIDAGMTLHDGRVTRFSQWWKRSQRAGHAYTEGAWLHGLSPERHWLRETVSIACWGVVLPLGALLSLALAPAVSLAIVLCYPLFGCRIFIRARRQGLPAADARLYAAACVVAKFPQALGQIRFYIGRLGARRSRLIEYKPT